MRSHRSRPTNLWTSLGFSLFVASSACLSASTDRVRADRADGAAGAQPGETGASGPMRPGVRHRFLEVQLNGSRAGGFEIETVVADDGSIRSTERFKLVMIRENTGYVDRFEIETRGSSEYTADFKLIREDSVNVEAGIETKTSIAIEGDELIFHYDGPSRKEDLRFPLPPDYRSGRIVFNELKARVDAGERDVKASYSSFDTSDRRFHRQTMTLHEKLTAQTPQGPMTAYRVTSRDEDDGQEVKAVADEEYEAIEIDMFGIFLAKWVAQSPFEGELGGRMTSELVVEGTIPSDWQRLAQMEIDVIVKDDGKEPLPLLETNHYQTVQREGDVYHVTLHSQRWEDGVKQGRYNGAKLSPGQSLPVDVKPFLEATALSQSDHADIIATSKELTATSNEPIDRARKVIAWVYMSLRKEGGARGSATAVEVLANRAGDCTEHAALGVALLRAAGIPARNADGIVLLSEGGRPVGGYHAWAEVWIGEWIAVDPMFFETGTTARYIHFGYNEPGMPGGGAKIGRTLGRTTIKVKSTKTFDQMR